MRGKGILLNDNYELQINVQRDGTGKIVSGLIIGDTLNQNTAQLLIGRKGDFKEQPALGVGIENILLDDDYLDWRRRIRLNLELDKQKIIDVKFSSVDQLMINANYTNG